MALPKGEVRIDAAMLFNMMTAAFALGKESKSALLQTAIETEEHVVKRAVVESIGSGKITVKSDDEDTFRTGSLLWTTLANVDRCKTYVLMEEYDA